MDWGHYQLKSEVCNFLLFFPALNTFVSLVHKPTVAFAFIGGNDVSQNFIII